MAYATSYYTGDNATKTFAFSFSYLSTDHIKAYVNGVAAAFTLSGSGQVTLNTAPAQGAAIQVRRETPVASPLVTFSNGSSVQGSDLNSAILQELYGLQEADDRAAELNGSYAAEASARAAAVTAEAKARADADTAEAKARSDADTAEVNARAAAITAEAKSRSDADTAAGNRLTTVEGKVQTLQNNAGSVSNQSYTAANGGTARNVALKLNDSPDLRDYNPTSGGTTDTSAAFATALNALAAVSGGTLTIGDVYLINPSSATTYVLPKKSELRFTGNGRLILGPNATLAISGQITAGARRIFDVSQGGVVTAVTPTGLNEILADWWGVDMTGVADSTVAFQAFVDFCIAAGEFGTLGSGVVLLTAPIYAVGKPFRLRCQRAQLQFYNNSWGQNTQSIGNGTWLHLAHTGKGIVFDVSRSGSDPVIGTVLGHVIDNGLGTYRDQPTPVTGQTFTPLDHDYDYQVNNGSAILDVVTLNSSNLIDLFNAGKTHIKKIVGQVLVRAVRALTNYDCILIDDVDLWPYWTYNDSVRKYMQDNMTGLTIARADGLRVKRWFQFQGYRAVWIRNYAGNGPALPAGTAAHVEIDYLYADSVDTALFVDAASDSCTVTVGTLINQPPDAGTADAAGTVGNDSIFRGRNSAGIIMNGTNSDVDIKRCSIAYSGGSLIAVYGTMNRLTIGRMMPSLFNRAQLNNPSGPTWPGMQCLGSGSRVDINELQCAPNYVPDPAIPLFQGNVQVLAGGNFDPSWTPHHDISANAKSLSPNARVVLPTGSGFLVLNEDATGSAAIMLLAGGGVTLVTNTGSVFSPGPTAGKVGVSYANGTYNIVNRYGSTMNVWISFTRMRPSP